MADRRSTENQRRVENWVADEVIPFQTPLGGRSISGWMAKGSTSIPAGEERTRQFAEQARSDGFRLFCGISKRMDPKTPVVGAAHLYLLEGASETDVAEFCDVGVPFDYNYPEVIRHALDATGPEHYGVWRDWIASGRYTIEDLSGPPPTKQRQRLSKLLETIFSRSPFTIIFAGDKVLKADFRSAVDGKNCTWIETRIVRYFSYATEAVGVESIADYIRDRQSVYFATRRKYQGEELPSHSP